MLYSYILPLNLVYQMINISSRMSSMERAKLFDKYETRGILIWIHYSLPILDVRLHSLIIFQLHNFHQPTSWPCTYTSAYPLIICRQSILGESLNKRSQADPLTRVRMSHKYYYYADMLRLLTPVLLLFEDIKEITFIHGNRMCLT